MRKILDEVMDIITTLQELKDKAIVEVEAVQTLDELKQIQAKYLGRKGLLRALTANLAALSAEEKKAAGQTINQIKQEIVQEIAKKQRVFNTTEPVSPTPQAFDITLPGEKRETGRRHPLYQTMSEISNIFKRLGFDIVYGPEIETEYYNFEALNIPLEHPSRDAFDTFYLSSKDKKYLLRSHTSPVQIRVMEKRQPPLQVIAPGKVFRPDTPSPSRFPMFHQVEGLMVGEDVNFAHLKGILDLFAKEFFGKDIKMRFRPSFFPFTEPSAEVDISCVICKGKGTGCSVCRGEGWLEVLGAGMVHPKVFEAVGYDPEKYTGFAFGMGVERLTMLKYHINDIRLFTENHLEFLNQF